MDWKFALGIEYLCNIDCIFLYPTNSQLAFMKAMLVN